MSEGGFKKVGDSEERMYGPRAVMICGYGTVEQQVVVKLLEKLEMADVPVVSVRAAQAETPIVNALGLSHGTGIGQSSGLKRAALMSGLTENELRRFMNAHREIQLPPPLWASLTPHSEKWTVGGLLDELAREAEAFHRRREEQPEP